MAIDERHENRFEAVTQNIRVRVTPNFLDHQSAPNENLFVWAYEVEIINESKATVQLRERSWQITNGNGERKDVNGPGVVGEQPILNPGDVFRYTSGCPLTTSSGFMVGNYTMANEAGELFEIEIPAFALDMPGARGTMN